MPITIKQPKQKRKQKRKQKPINVENFFAISQGEVGITNNDSPKYILGTFNANPCVILTAYNPNTKEIALTHIDDITDLLQTLSMINRELTKKKKVDLIVNLATGELDDNSTLQSLKDHLNEAHLQNMKLEKIITADSLAIDARNGNVYQDIPYEMLDLNKDYEKRIKKRCDDIMVYISSIQKIESQLFFDGRNLTNSNQCNSNEINDSSLQNSQPLINENKPSTSKI